MFLPKTRDTYSICFELAQPFWKDKACGLDNAITDPMGFTKEKKELNILNILN